MIHTGEEFLWVACHDTSDRCKHLGSGLLDDAIAWVKGCEAAGASLPTAVVKSFVPSEACLCRCHSRRYRGPPSTVDGAFGSLGASSSFRSIVANTLPSSVFAENQYTSVVHPFSPKVPPRYSRLNTPPTPLSISFINVSTTPRILCLSETLFTPLSRRSLAHTTAISSLQTPLPAASASYTSFATAMLALAMPCGSCSPLRAADNTIVVGSLVSSS